MAELWWICSPPIAHRPSTQAWLTLHSTPGLDPTTMDAHGRDLREHLAFCR